MLKNGFYHGSILISCLMLFLLSPLSYAFVESSVKAHIEIMPHTTHYLKNSKQFKLNIMMKLPDGWKTFGKEPGDIGEATTFMLNDSSNIQAFDITWPKTKIDKVYDFKINVYEGNIIFPIDVVKTDASKPFHFTLHVTYNLCKLGECLPRQETITFSQPNK